MIPEDRATLRRILWFLACIVPVSLIVGAAFPLMFWGSVSQHYVGSKLPKAWRTNETEVVK